MHGLESGEAFFNWAARAEMVLLLIVVVVVDVCDDGDTDG